LINRDDVPYNISDFTKEIDTKNNWNNIENSELILKLRNLLNNISYSLYHRKDNYDQFFDMQLQDIKCIFQSKNNINSVIENFVFIVDDINNPELNIRVVKNAFFSWMKGYINEYTNGVNFRSFITLQIIKLNFHSKLLHFFEFLARIHVGNYIDVLSQFLPEFYVFDKQEMKCKIFVNLQRCQSPYIYNLEDFRKFLNILAEANDT
ncbi:hypothetical protein COBT_001340, partial [Conglomerata obtusa]